MGPASVERMKVTVPSSEHVDQKTLVKKFNAFFYLKREIGDCGARLRLLQFLTTQLAAACQVQGNATLHLSVQN